MQGAAILELTEMAADPDATWIARAHASYRMDDGRSWSTQHPSFDSLPTLCRTPMIYDGIRLDKWADQPATVAS